MATLALPWYRAGTSQRSALRLVAALRGAGLLSRVPAQLFFAAIALVPGLVAVSWVFGVAGYPRLAALAAATSGLLLVGAALAVKTVAHHRATSGTTLALVAGSAAWAGAMLVAVHSRSCSSSWRRADS